MPKPILLSIDDDSDVLRAIERDLRSQYGAEYRVIGSDSPDGALDLLKQLKVRNDSVALLLAFLAIYLSTGKFDFTELADMGRNGTLTTALSAELGWKSINS